VSQPSMPFEARSQRNPWHPTIDYNNTIFELHDPTLLFTFLGLIISIIFAQPTYFV
jgi:hypothetical protein